MPVISLPAPVISLLVPVISLPAPVISLLVPVIFSSQHTTNKNECIELRGPPSACYQCAARQAKIWVFNPGTLQEGAETQNSVKK